MIKHQNNLKVMRNRHENSSWAAIPGGANIFTNAFAFYRQVAEVSYNSCTFA